MAEKRIKCSWTFSWVIGLGPRSLKLQNKNTHLLSSHFQAIPAPTEVMDSRVQVLFPPLLHCNLLLEWKKSKTCAARKTCELQPHSEIFENEAGQCLLPKSQLLGGSCSNFPVIHFTGPYPIVFLGDLSWQRTCNPWRCNTALSAGWRRGERNPVRETGLWGRWKTCSQSGETLADNL